MLKANHPFTRKPLPHKPGPRPKKCHHCGRSHNKREIAQTTSQTSHSFQTGDIQNSRVLRKFATGSPISLMESYPTRGGVCS